MVFLVWSLGTRMDGKCSSRQKHHGQGKGISHDKFLKSVASGSPGLIKLAFFFFFFPGRGKKGPHRFTDQGSTQDEVPLMATIQL